MLKKLLDRPLVIFMVAAMLFLGGILCAYLLPIQILPQMDAPFVNVFVNLERETDLDTVEREISIPLETVALSNQGVKQVDVNTNTRTVRVNILLKDSAKDEDINKLKEELNQKITSISLDVQSSDVKQYSTADNSFMALAFVPRDVEDENIKSEIENVVLPALSRIPEIRSVHDSIGDYDQRYVFELRPEKVRSLQTAAGILEEIKGSFSSPLLGSLSYGGQNYRVRSEASISQPGEIPTFRLSTGDTIADVADMRTERQAEKSVNVHNDKPYFYVEMTISESASEVDVAKKVYKVLDQLYENKTTDWEYYFIWDSSKFIGQAINELVKNIIIGSVVAAGLLLLIFRSVKTMLVIGISIPLCLVSTFISMKLFDFSINMITLMGLGIGTGMIVDACIVVLENIFRKLQDGLPKREAVLEGTKEVQGPVASSILTTIAVFAPIAFLEGMIGAMMRQLAVTVSISLAASFFVAVTIIPILADYLVEPKEKESVPSFGLLMYEKLLLYVLDHKKRIMATFTVALVAMVALLVIYVPKAYIPDVRERALFVRYNIDEKTDFAISKGLMEGVSKRLKEIEGVQDVIYWANEGSSHRASFYIHYNPEKEMTRSEEEVNQDVAQVFADTIPYSFISIGSGQTDTSGRITLSLTSSSMSKMQQELGEIERQLQMFPGVTGVETDVFRASEEWVIDFSREQLQHYGLRRVDIERYLALVLRGEPDFTFKIDGKEVRGSVLFPEIYRKSSDALYVLPLVENQQITLQDVATLSTHQAEQSRVRKDGDYQTQITVFYQQEMLSQLMPQVETLIAAKQGGRF